MSAEDSQWFEIVKSKVLTAGTEEVVATVQGRAYSELVVKRLDNRLTPEDQMEGWGHHLRPGQKPPGMKAYQNKRRPGRRDTRE